MQAIFLLFVAWFGLGTCQPTFPDEAEAVVGDLSAQFAEVAPAPDPSVVKKLVEDGSAALTRDVVEEMVAKAAGQVVRTAEHVRTLKMQFLGGCSRDFTGCPTGWAVKGSTCEPGSDYVGYCGAVVLGNLALAEKEEFAWKCEASFPCAGASGFLQVLPVDAYKIRNSLFLTQPMRSPPQASVNVISKEDPGLIVQAKYEGMENQVERLRGAFASRLQGLAMT